MRRNKLHSRLKIKTKEIPNKSVCPKFTLADNSIREHTLGYNNMQVH